MKITLKDSRVIYFRKNSSGVILRVLEYGPYGKELLYVLIEGVLKKDLKSLQEAGNLFNSKKEKLKCQRKKERQLGSGLCTEVNLTLRQMRCLSRKKKMYFQINGHVIVLIPPCLQKKLDPKQARIALLEKELRSLKGRKEVGSNQQSARKKYWANKSPEEIMERIALMNKARLNKKQLGASNGHREIVKAAMG